MSKSKPVVLLLGGLLAMALVLLVAGCGADYNATRTWEGSVWTVRHENHTFVCHTSGGIIHHPGCPCLNK